MKHIKLLLLLLCSFFKIALFSTQENLINETKSCKAQETPLFKSPRLTSSEFQKLFNRPPILSTKNEITENLSTLKFPRIRRRIKSYKEKEFEKIYTIIEEILKTDFGIIQKVQKKTRLPFKKIFVAKKAYPERTSISCIEREFFLLSLLNHQHIIPLKGLITSNDCTKTTGIILPFYQKDLFTFLEKNRKERRSKESRLLLKRKKLRIALGIALGIKYLHKNHIIHKDIKPENILLTKKNQPVIADFGLAEKNLFGIFEKPQGSYIYIAPEILNGEKFSFSADIYSLGVTLYVLMRERMPFKVSYPQDDPNYLEFLIEEKLSTSFLKCPVGSCLEEAIRCCTKCNPEDRCSIDTVIDIINEEIELC